MNYLDLFSGIGGFHKGLLQAGFHFNWCGYSEIDKYAKQIYQKHFPESEGLGDVRTIKVDRLPKINLITFGFPCQDLSIAGKRGGITASRSGLFFEAMRIIRATRPCYFIFENVKGLFSSNEGRDWLAVLREVADSGYDGQWQLLNTRCFGLPHNRERVYFVGHNRGMRQPQIFPIKQEDGRHVNEDGVQVSRRGVLRPIFTLSMPTESRRAILHNRRLRHFTEIEYARLQGFPDDWFNGFSWGVAHKCSGNSVTVPIIESIGRKLLKDNDVAS